MSRSVNSVTLLGRLGKDAESKRTPSGISVATFSVALGYRTKDGDEWKDKTEWVNVTLWKAENVAPYLVKGTQVFIQGRLQTRNYEKDGKKVYVTEVIANEVILLGGKASEESGKAVPVGDNPW